MTDSDVACQVCCEAEGIRLHIDGYQKRTVQIGAQRATAATVQCMASGRLVCDRITTNWIGGEGRNGRRG